MHRGGSPFEREIEFGEGTSVSGVPEDHITPIVLGNKLESEHLLIFGRGDLGHHLHHLEEFCLCNHITLIKAAVASVFQEQ